MALSHGELPNLEITDDVLPLTGDESSQACGNQETQLLANHHVFLPGKAIGQIAQVRSREFSPAPAEAPGRRKLLTSAAERPRELRLSPPGSEAS
jgi:hypothetical protein